MKDFQILGEKEADIIVSKLTPLKNGMFEVSFDNDKKLILNEDEVVSYRLVKGKGITYADYDAIVEKMSFYEAYDKALKYSLSYFKSSHEIYQYLENKGYNSNVAADVVQTLIDNKVINDNEYQKIYIEKLIRDGNGRLMISYKLKEKKLNGDYTINEELYFNTLNTLITKKLKTLKDKKKERLYRYLISKGYTTDDINQALKGVSFE